MELNYTAIGARLKFLRGSLSQTAFGDSIGYSYGYVKNCEHGKKPSIEYLHKVVEHYGASISWIIYGIEPIYANSEIKKNDMSFDSDLEQMTITLKKLIESDDPDIRGWTKVQFKRIFT
jgi:transcriptional regulator with XRE-family HTH domain